MSVDIMTSRRTRRVLTCISKFSKWSVERFPDLPWCNIGPVDEGIRRTPVRELVGVRWREGACLCFSYNAKEF
ncbi:hypothetical protein PAXRUDRAFT_830221 [Paxillus rubicundulus Ve08.2h10]|uniref:Uncharacterized protein n=1 Tax=Paxillus rubicundulus Ve08.2h10 TaxID=930991 RepID=A0A0D0D5Y2_9AGAM|nr:hypothetical protein PAXRUDRAFT_830221 [Paxillus rubicundulus Ve08.2h10]